MLNSKSQQYSVNKMFNQNLFCFIHLTGATWWNHAIYIVFTYFASFTDYEDNIFEVISHLRVQISKFGGQIKKCGGKKKKKLNSVKFIESVFSKSAL